MKKLSLILLSVLLVLTACTSKESMELTSSETIAQHVVWKVIKTNELDINGLPASINILDVDLKKFDGDIDLAWYPEDLIITSEIALEHNALAAVNGSFFDMKVGGAWVFLQDDGKQVAGNKSKVIFSHNGAFAEDTKGNIVILERPETDWEADPTYDYVMSSGPLMIYEGDIYPMDSVAFNLDRHPRTAVGLTKDKHLILVTVDGRQKDAVGMSIPELTELMKDLKCVDALNLDGGGSTTMYIKGEDHQGIVNYPTDNRTFDHEGERPVSNAILVLEK
jgi:exopolysaccharide biosynthesis protein